MSKTYVPAGYQSVLTLYETQNAIGVIHHAFEEHLGQTLNLKRVSAPHFKALTAAQCKRLGIEVLAMECHIDHAYLFLSCLPTLSPSDIMHQLKGATSFALREQFPQLAKMPSLWTRSFFVSTEGNVSSDTIKWYVDTQKTRY